MLLYNLPVPGTVIYYFVGEIISLNITELKVLVYEGETAMFICNYVSLRPVMITDQNYTHLQDPRLSTELIMSENEGNSIEDNFIAVVSFENIQRSDNGRKLRCKHDNEYSDTVTIMVYGKFKLCRQA